MFSIFAFLVLSLIAGWRGFVLFSMIARLESAKNWKKTIATVEDSRVTESGYRRMDGKITRNLFFSFFEHGGIRYGCFRPSLYSDDKKFVSRTLERTKVGDKVEIYYDPENPQDNVLVDPRRHGNLVNTLLFILSFLVLSIFSVFALIG